MDKVSRVLMLFNSFIKGAKINKADFSNRYEINGRTFDRDIEAIRNFLAEVNVHVEIQFDKAQNVYYMPNIHIYDDRKMGSIEAIILLKLLLSSRVLRKDEMQGIVRSLYSLLDKAEKKLTINSISDEMENYISPVHGKSIMKMLEDLNKVIQRRIKIDLNYIEKSGLAIKQRVLPVSFIFCEFYFYLIAFLDERNCNFPRIFRVDRIKNFQMTNEKYNENLYERYNQKNMRKHLQFMDAGEITNARIRCRDSNVELLRDRFPDCWLIKDEGEWKIFGAKIFGGGFISWILSQGSNVELLEPVDLRYKLIKQIKEINKIYKIQY